MKLTETQNQKLKGKICPYCNKESQYKDSSIIYGRSYGMIYICVPCDAYVGVHKGTDKALGRLANSELRYWKKEAHKYFDLLWKDKKLIKRKNAYMELSKYLKIQKEFCHIGYFDVNSCNKVVEWSKKALIDLQTFSIISM